ncbi:MAG: tetratricopeptide repeat protein, partial [Desulfatiglandales bacterium]
ATGMRPFKHGIHGFIEPNPDAGGVRPVTNSSRKVKAIWNILNQNGYKSNVIGWWPSHPAEPIRGVMVSNHYQRAKTPIDKPWPMMPGTIHPPKLVRKIADLRIHPAELGPGQILPFIPKAGEIDQKKDPRLEMVAKIIADCSTIHACATAVIQLEPWDFMAVYYDAIDHFGHGFMKYHPPRQKHIPEKDFEHYKDVVEGGYRFHDMMLGVLLKLAGEDTTVILISDHGFHPDHLRPARIPHEPAGPAVEHRPYGIFVMKGPGIKKDDTVFGATLLDITPTILTLYGLPVGEDMQGKPLVHAFKEPPDIETTPSWEEIEGDDGRHPPDRQMDPVESQEAIKQLVALGYIEDPGEDKEKAAKNAVREARYNLAQDYVDANLHTEALPILEELWRVEPDEIRFAYRLVNCYQALDRIGECRQTVETINKTQVRLAKDARKKLKEIAEKQKQEGKKKDVEKKELTQNEKLEIRRLRSQARPGKFSREFMMGSLLFAEGKLVDALEHLKNAEKAKPRLPNLHLQIGNIYNKMKKWTYAEKAFRKALEIDPDNAQAHLGLCLSLLPRRKNMEAGKEALAAVGMLYHYPQAHFYLGVALHRVGFTEQAVEAFKVALSQNPNIAEAHKRLAHIYKYRLPNPEKAQHHREQILEIRKQRRARRKALREASQGRKRIVREKQESTPTDISGKEGVSPSVDSVDSDVPRIEFPSKEEKDFITVVSGLPRSGTSMLMQMLDAGGHPCLTDKERKADDNNPRGYFELEKVKQLRKDRSWLPDAKGKAVKIIAQLLPFLPPRFHYRVIFMERDIKEVLASQRKMLEHRGRSGAKVSDESLGKTFRRQVRQVKE